ncbi:MAG: cobyric acid synthase [bacterium]
MSKSLMIQGTGSGVGKSLIVAALCRIFRQDGYKVAPFKAQNMALNSFITKDGGEMGRAQIVQAEAAGIEPTVDMNPILIKPTSDRGAQIIVHGKVMDNMEAKEYHQYKKVLLNKVLESFKRLSAKYDLIVIEGAGSPAEVNLRENDLVNMGLATIINSPVLLVGDIDKGGVFASFVGTLELLDQPERELIQGFVINKFRGDLQLLRPGLEFLEKKTAKPVLGVIPYLKDLYIQEEDSIVENKILSKNNNFTLKIAVIYLPHISNFTDFDALAHESDVDLDYIKTRQELKGYDLVIIPGTKNTIGDLIYLKENGLAERIKAYYYQSGGVIVGICGGYQILGQTIFDPFHVESSRDSIEGLGVFEIDSRLEREKITSQVKAKILADFGIEDLLTGYEIHMGESKYRGDVLVFSKLLRNDGQEVIDGALDKDGLSFGTYIHGLFDNDLFRRRYLNILRRKKGFEALNQDQNYSFFQNKEENYNRLAKIVRENLDIRRLL